MCGTTPVGTSTMLPTMNSTAAGTGQVAGASGAADVAGGGPAASLLPMLDSLTKAIEALRQAIAGMQGIGGGGSDSVMQGCDMVSQTPVQSYDDVRGGAEELPDDKPADKPADKPSDKPGDKPDVTPDDKPVDPPVRPPVDPPGVKEAVQLMSAFGLSDSANGKIAQMALTNGAGKHVASVAFYPNDQPSKTFTFDKLDIGNGEARAATLTATRQPGPNGTWNVKWTLSFPNSAVPPKNDLTVGVTNSTLIDGARSKAAGAKARMVGNQISVSIGNASNTGVLPKPRPGETAFVIIPVTFSSGGQRFVANVKVTVVTVAREGQRIVETKVQGIHQALPTGGGVGGNSRVL